MREWIWKKWLKKRIKVPDRESQNWNSVRTETSVEKRENGSDNENETNIESESENKSNISHIKKMILRMRIKVWIFYSLSLNDK